MANRLSILLTATAALSLLGAGAAGAQTSATKKAPAPKAQAAKAAPRHPVVIAEMSDAMFRKPLVIQKRSFLDPGNVVPVGQDTPVNVVFNTDEYRGVTQSYDKAFFGNSELPGRFDLPPTNPRFNISAQPHIPLPFDE